MSSAYVALVIDSAAQVGKFYSCLLADVSTKVKVKVLKISE